jgi:hypothetical protein
LALDFRHIELLEPLLLLIRFLTEAHRKGRATSFDDLMAESFGIQQYRNAGTFSFPPASRLVAALLHFRKAEAGAPWRSMKTESTEARRFSDKEFGGALRFVK